MFQIRKIYTKKKVENNISKKHAKKDAKKGRGCIFDFSDFIIS